MLVQPGKNISLIWHVVEKIKAKNESHADAD